MENQRSLSDCFLWIEAEVISHNKFQLSAGEPPQLSGAPAGSLDFIKVWILQDMMMVYDGDQARYAKISGHGFRMLAEAMEADLPYEIRCPALLICGKKDHAGSCIRYNKAWHKNTGIPIAWIRDAGHNSNTDAPETVNRLIEELVVTI